MLKQIFINLETECSMFNFKVVITSSYINTQWYNSFKICIIIAKTIECFQQKIKLCIIKEKI